MKIILHDNKSYILRFDGGEDVIVGLLHFAKTEKIEAAHFTALGASGEVTLSYYNLVSKSYEDREFFEDLEILTMVGNIAWMDGEPVVHAHGTFGRHNFSTLGGHVKRLVVSATCEVHLQKLDGGLARSFDSITGLNLL